MNNVLKTRDNKTPNKIIERPSSGNYQQFSNIYSRGMNIGSRDCDVSNDCNDPVGQSECSVLKFMRNNVLFKFVFVKIKPFRLMDTLG